MFINDWSVFWYNNCGINRDRVVIIIHQSLRLGNIPWVKLKIPDFSLTLQNHFSWHRWQCMTDPWQYSPSMASRSAAYSCLSSSWLFFFWVGFLLAAGFASAFFPAAPSCFPPVAAFLFLGSELAFSLISEWKTKNKEYHTLFVCSRIRSLVSQFTVDRKCFVYSRYCLSS